MSVDKTQVETGSDLADPQRNDNCPLILAFVVSGLFVPSLITWIYFVVLASASPTWQLLAGGIGKAVQFSLPMILIILVLRRRPQFRWPSHLDCTWGAVIGVAIAVAMLLLYFAWLRGSTVFTSAAEPIRNKVSNLGVDSVSKYLVMAAFYSLIHALLEEYYWRWFIYGQLRKLTALWVAVAVSSIGFAAHHVILLGYYFGLTSPLTWLFALGVAVGGAIWAVHYEHSRALWGIWLSHALVDAAIFTIGYQLIAHSIT